MVFRARGERNWRDQRLTFALVWSTPDRRPRWTMSSTGDSKHAQFAASLRPEERVLLSLRDELYLGSWANMQTDLDQRMKGRPFIFKLVSRIEEDLERIRRLSAYEADHRINLSDYLEGLD